MMTGAGSDVLARAVRTVLSDSEFVEREHLRLPGYKKSQLRQFTGRCYVASESYFHLAGGRESGLKLRHAKLRYAINGFPAGTSHYWLVGTDDSPIDLTAEQFECAFPYELGIGWEFLTCQPSVRAQKIIDRATEPYPSLIVTCPNLLPPL